MNKDELIAWIALPFIVLLGFLLAWAGSDGGKAYASLPVFFWCAIVSFGIQWLAFIPAFFKQTEKFYDLTGSLTYLTSLGLALYLSGDFDFSSLLLSLLITLWAVRLGSFLFLRIQAVGEDSRFREIKKSFPRFLVAWSLQGLWVIFSMAAAWAAITTQSKATPNLLTGMGILIWLIGFGIEVIADQQKSNFRKSPENAAQFIQSGLWAWSRHPNYFGEILLWVGIALIALPQLRGWQVLTLVSPLFITLLLTRISGIPLLEAKSDLKWSGQADYEHYKATTPALILRPPARKYINKDPE
ncbi:hypothetical protein COW36_08550 [bacterium (Candidatus Blackallbacteria) CG17_big_fil_post_rev_8_21_14_2_50_48_46]|uniref:Uncharacterized protein n=1 Tax=bacterium (Candidatus Blackallbacteria) CG17_big_fil_post_rev_8_21_14_2_50_48_46 TaxID=2014261 RepID=A0A2M7G772_9BACT|nr:MAG: hypothetical protein COW64_05850 [bacterium (Candidatus Blackallbacteria) CG18_big_fil_WC_8_21_14_2_50_49_26]PIW17536.1 MAG: hypothetical protein COW36_08550 [bacterium (Candidatus Blackallbacteria) CG17_big_fil_post_rev_8_21_14_2_50_48_46]PIW48391.1 MAG: hypothetical protein COW20_09900 [bacterium (Candidatus Blackallbacteria) CG13_big_fil_rev_8_21_14_2_50_49_14]